MRSVNSQEQLRIELLRKCVERASQDECLRADVEHHVVAGRFHSADGISGQKHGASILFYEDSLGECGGKELADPLNGGGKPLRRYWVQQGGESVWFKSRQPVIVVGGNKYHRQRARR